MASDIEEIKQRLDLVDVIREYVPVKPAGPASFKVLCPFHHEKTPSLHVSKDKQVWHCFGCGKGGDVFVFVQEMEGMDFAEALKHLARKAGVELKGSDPRLNSQKLKVQEVVRAAARLYNRVLLESNVAQPARDYLTKRGLTDDTIDRFQLGYAPAEWDFLYTTLKKQNVPEELLFQAGLTVRREKGSGFYDRFRGRVMFPINDVNGVTVGFGARQLESVAAPGATEGAKYINTPQSLVYDKSRILYGLDRAKNRIKEEKQVIIVEGYMDVIASHQAGITNVVASSGTALTAEHVRLLKRFTPNLVFAFDMDEAGEGASRRGIDTALEQEVDVRLVVLPSGKDPDELIRSNPEAWKQAIKDAKPVLEALMQRTLGRLDVTGVQGKKQAAAELLPVIAKLGNPIERSHYMQALARALGLEESVLRETLGRLKPVAPGTAKSTVAPAAAETNRRELQAERLIGLLLHAPQLFPTVVDRLLPKAFPAPFSDLYTQMLVWYNRAHTFDPSAFLTTVRDSVLKSRLDVARLAVERDFAQADSPVIEHELTTLLSSLQKEFFTTRLRQLTADIARAEQSSDPHERDTVTTLVTELNELTRQLREL
jgi:DNA primase